MLMTPSAACGTGGNGYNTGTTRYGLNYFLHQIFFIKVNILVE